MTCAANSSTSATSSISAASFELLIHAILRQLGCSVQVEPDRGTNRARPDFLVEHGDERFYLEVTVSTATGATRGPSANEEMVYGWIDKIDSPNFYLMAAIDGEAVLRASQTQGG